jgi:hypothetical protein
MNVLLRRDDGATTVLANVPGDGALRTATVPVKGERWTLSEFEAFAFEPATGELTKGRERRGVVQTGTETRAAASLQRARERRGRDEGFDADLVAGLDLDSSTAALE